MKAGTTTNVRHACQEFLETTSRFYGVPDCEIRVLAARPLRVRENWASELFGDYTPETMLIRVWMRTAVRKEITSFGTFLSTLCHEFCHHLDFQQFRFPDSWHTRGFYERAAALYHHARDTAPERRFPESRRKAYYLMSIHEYLPPQVRKELKQVGWTKGRELAKLVRAQGQGFDCAPWVHKARVLPKEQFRHEVEKELTGKETEPWEMIYFKLYKSQIPVIEQALETAALMLGSDRSRGYCLEMICADFLAGANLDSGDPDVLLRALSRFFEFLPGEQRQAFAEFVTDKIQ